MVNKKVTDACFIYNDEENINYINSETIQKRKKT